MYIFPCHSLNSFHLLIPLLCPPVHSLRLCLYSGPANRFTSTIFLDFTYMHYHTVFVFLFLTYSTLHRLEVPSPHYNWLKIQLFLWLSNIPFIYVPQLLYPLICQWTSRLLSYPGYRKYCYNEHWGTCVFCIMVFSGICQIMRFLGHMVILFLGF